MADASEYFQYTTERLTFARRHYLSQCLREKTDSRVQYGILKGYEIGQVHWAPAAVGAYLLGTYEVQVCAILDHLKSPRSTLIDIGAAEGLYGIGLIAVGAFGRSLCFEADDTSRENLIERRTKFELEDRVTIYAEANRKTLEAGLRESGADLKKCLVICDIEGGEFDLFDRKTLEMFSDCRLIIEIHDFLIENGAIAFRNLKRRAAPIFNIHEIRDGIRYMRNIPLLDGWSDADTWMMCMEGRKRMMTWLYLTPKSESLLSQQDIDRLTLDYQKRMLD